ncbi:uncharacterized protein LOC133848839 isoform X2 [Drosophila sulfurigaster albostrigata]|uniref:uncharacterized protein LOC133848839 isoform X2 n=1 Tax=Drosophila sulfurigaster albostrigata TaxID=89887 RepID=UPI002D21DE9F|nr:uncharacterized protein LOC133848839 isoform X2 [Drosophila sulfurigaster albostrigata]
MDSSDLSDSSKSSNSSNESIVSIIWNAAKTKVSESSDLIDEITSEESETTDDCDMEQLSKEAPIKVSEIIDDINVSINREEVQQIPAIKDITESGKQQKICAVTSINVPHMWEAGRGICEALGLEVVNEIVTEKKETVQFDPAKLEAEEAKVKDIELARTLEKRESSNAFYDADASKSSENNFPNASRALEVQKEDETNSMYSETDTLTMTDEATTIDTSTDTASSVYLSEDGMSLSLEMTMTTIDGKNIGDKSRSWKFNEMNYKPMESQSYKIIDLAAAQKIWKTFKDEDYVNGFENKNIRVPLRPFFTYMKAPEDKGQVLIAPPKITLEHIASEMLENNYGAYMHVEIGKHVFDCIPRLLKVYSKWFERLNRNIIEVMLDERDVPPKGFRAIYRWMRTQKTIIKKHSVKAMQGAKYLQIDTLEMELWDLLSDPEIRERAAFDLFASAGNLSLLDDFRPLMAGRVRNYFLPLVASEDFVKLQPQQLIVLLKATTLGVNSEIEVLYAAVRWILHKTQDRLPHMQEVMQSLRFIYMPMGFLFSLRGGTLGKATEDINTPDYVLLEFSKDRILQNHLSEAMSFIGMDMQSDEETDTDSEGFGKRALARKQESPRRWIYFPMCKYHMPHVVYPYAHHFKYAQFIEFISSMQLDWMAEAKFVNSEYDIEA